MFKAWGFIPAYSSWFIKIKGSVHQEDIVSTNVCSHYSKIPLYEEQKPTEGSDVPRTTVRDSTLPVIDDMG